jgi:2-methylcitrate dehydratase PrpD
LIGDPRDPLWFRPDAVKDPITRQLAGKVEIVIDPAVEAVYPAQFGASVKLIRADGSVSERSVMECHGTPADPCSDAELKDKFSLLAGARLPAATVAALAGLVDRVADIRVRELTSPLRAAGPVLLHERSRA